MGADKEDVLAVLVAARVVLDVEGWTKGTYARDAEGVAVAPESRRAACFCAYGAMMTVTPGEFWSVRHEAEDALREALDLPIPVIGGWNDESTKAEVLAAFDKAIANAEASLG